MNGEDSFLLKARIDNAVSTYHAFLFPETALYNGAEYVIYQHKLDEGDPFFQSRYFDSSSVFYDGIFYTNIRMSYDIIQGVVIVDYPVNASRIQLENDLVDRFTLGTHHFMRIDKDSSGNLFPGTGFYEVLYRGTNLLLKKQTKEVNEVNLVEGVRRTINERIVYYLKKNGVYYSVNNKGSLLDALRDKKKSRAALGIPHLVAVGLEAGADRGADAREFFRGEIADHREVHAVGVPREKGLADERARDAAGVADVEVLFVGEFGQLLRVVFEDREIAKAVGVEQLHAVRAMFRRERGLLKREAFGQI